MSRQEQEETVEGPVTTLRPTAPAKAVECGSSLARGPSPAPGFLSPPFLWGNILETPRPWTAGARAGGYAIYSGQEMGASVRITHTTLVSVSREGTVRVDNRVSVENRLFVRLIERERAAFRRSVARAESRLEVRLRRQRAFAERAPRVLAVMLLFLVRAHALFGHWGIRTYRGASRLAVELPDNLYSRVLQVSNHLSDKLGRRSLWQGLKDPQGLTGGQKSVVLFLSSLILVATLLLLNTTVPLIFPGVAHAYRDLFTAFTLGFATAAILPFPPSELLVIPPYLSAGPALAFLAIFLSKVVAAWMLFFVGDTLHGLIARQTEGRPRMKRLVAWMERNSSRYGFWIMTVFMALPFLPDTVALMVFAVSGTTFRGYLGGVALGTAIRYGAVVGILMLYGPAQIESLFG